MGAVGAFRRLTGMMFWCLDFRGRLSALARLALSLALIGMLLVACSRRLQPADSAAERSEAAKALFDQTTRSFHIPSAEAKGAEKRHLQEEAIRGYARLVKEYPEQEYWAA